MNNQFDELTKGVAQSVTRRAALKKLGVSLVGMALASVGLASKAQAAAGGGYCVVLGDYTGRGGSYTGICVNTATCQRGTSSQCKGTPKRKHLAANPCDPLHWTSIDTSKPCSF